MSKRTFIIEEEEFNVISYSHYYEVEAELLEEAIDLVKKRVVVPVDYETNYEPCWEAKDIINMLKGKEPWSKIVHTEEGPSRVQRELDMALQEQRDLLLKAEMARQKIDSLQKVK